MSSFRWKREFDNVTVEYFNSHLPPKSSASRVIYLVVQFINLIYDETELLGFTALALPAGKNLTAICGIYSERKQHYIERFPYMRGPSQQVTENSKPDFRGQMLQRRLGCLAAPRSARCRQVPFRKRRKLAPRTRLSGSEAAGGSRSSAGGRRGPEVPVPRSPLSGAHTRPAEVGGKVRAMNFQEQIFFPSIRRCPSAIAWTQVREGDGICDSLTPQYLCL